MADQYRDGVERLVAHLRVLERFGKALDLKDSPSRPRPIVQSKPAPRGITETARPMCRSNAVPQQTRVNSSDFPLRAKRPLATSTARR